VRADASLNQEKSTMPETMNSALLILDYQVGVGDQAYAHDASLRAAEALAAGRKAGLLIIFSKVNFLPDYSDIALTNKAFAPFRTKNLLPPGASRLIPLFQPTHDEVVVDKDRFSAFCGNDLTDVLRAANVKHLIMAGVSTGGVILSTFSAAADEDYVMTILSDACADPKPTLHNELMTNLFPRSATVVTVNDWITSLTAK
jgi:nicotinamidase-related amidase